MVQTLYLYKFKPVTNQKQPTYKKIKTKQEKEQLR